MFKWEIALNEFIEKEKDYTLNNIPKKAIDEVSITHLKCGNTFTTQARRLKATNCPCVRDCRPIKKTHNKFIEEINNIYQDEYEVLGLYENARTPIVVRHNECNSQFKTTPNAILSDNGCPFCFGKQKLTHNKFLNTVQELTNGEYEVLGNYKLSRKKIKMRHNSCKHEYYVTPNKFISGRRCPSCNSSIGEEKIRRWLEDNNLLFLSEYSFEDLIGKAGMPLRFDFAVLNNDEAVDFLIEFDGRQHFQQIDFFGGKEGLKERVKRDKRKDRYCLKNNIELIRISYKEINQISEILNRRVNHM